MAPNPRVALVRKQAENLLVKLHNDVIEHQDSTGFTGYLKMMTRQNRSFHNMWLIYTQCPHATYCLGYQQWIDVGRHVKKGEKGLLIYRPIPIKGKKDSEDESSVTFATTYVYDISQTAVIEGMEDKFTTFWESVFKPAVYTDAVPVENLFKYCEQAGIFLENDDTKLLDSYGYATTVHHPSYRSLAPHYDYVINIRNDLEDALYSRTLIHEIAHVMLHLSPHNEMNKDARVISQPDKNDHSDWYEWEAEATAYTVFAHFGIDLTPSIQYLSRYSPPAEFLLYSTGRIYKAAQKIIEIINQEGTANGVQAEEALATAA